jgi:RNAse (barnase) inhibitor barstar
MNKPTYIIDGNDFDDLEGLYDQISAVLIPGKAWGRGLDALNDILRGGFGTPKEGFTLIWKNSARSRRMLSYDETIKFYEQGIPTTKRSLTPEKLKKQYPSNKDWSRQKLREYVYYMDELAYARARQGPTIFDKIVELIKLHPYIELYLE